ncbi:hypothetical protein B0H65DRAFT_462851 [Neurospora tetraspora]|uniref:Uncharacterized protein n=1 Tax=Neurospora tetraspora TaxID=94610 RepID=A0AAE0JHZ9_9PEZI|nr:hypothetical protein B0H65DRAFT_462851 [Neurospora tetraspora]
MVSRWLTHHAYSLAWDKYQCHPPPLLSWHSTIRITQTWHIAKVTGRRRSIRCSSSVGSSSFTIAVQASHYDRDSKQEEKSTSGLTKGLHRTTIECDRHGLSVSSPRISIEFLSTGRQHHQLRSSASRFVAKWPGVCKRLDGAKRIGMLYGQVQLQGRVLFQNSNAGANAYDMLEHARFSAVWDISNKHSLPVDRRKVSWNSSQSVERGRSDIYPCTYQQGCKHNVLFQRGRRGQNDVHNAPP